MSTQHKVVDLLDRQIPKKKEVALSSFSLLAIALIQYNLSKSANVQELEEKLNEFSTHRERVKNIVNERIDAKGNVHIGDKDNKDNSLYDKKNVVNAPIKTEGDFHLGDG